MPRISNSEIVQKDNALDIYKKYNLVRPESRQQDVLRDIYESGSLHESLNESKQMLAAWREDFEAINNEITTCLVALQTDPNCNQTVMKKKLVKFQAEKQSLLEAKGYVEAKIQQDTDYIAYCRGHFGNL